MSNVEYVNVVGMVNPVPVYVSETDLNIPHVDQGTLKEISTKSLCAVLDVLKMKKEEIEAEMEILSAEVESRI